MPTTKVTLYKGAGANIRLTRSVTEEMRKRIWDRFYVGLREGNQHLTPYRTGRLMRSMRIRENRTGTLSVKWIAPYAKYVNARQHFVERVVNFAREFVRYGV